MLSFSNIKCFIFHSYINPMTVYKDIMPAIIEESDIYDCNLSIL